LFHYAVAYKTGALASGVNSIEKSFEALLKFAKNVLKLGQAIIVLRWNQDFDSSTRKMLQAG
jgi:hypothetical protein